MSDRYVIKNCPAYIHRPLNTHDRVCLLGDKVKPNHKELYVYCKDCTDCVMKQIVELCKKAIKDCDKCKGDPETDCYDCTQGGKAIQSDKILELLDIQEVE